MPNSVVEATDSPPVSQRDWRLGVKHRVNCKMLTALQKAPPFCAQSVDTHGPMLWGLRPRPPPLLQCHHDASHIWHLSLLGVSSPWLCMRMCVHDTKLVQAGGTWECSVHWPQILMKHIIWTWALFNYLTPWNCLPLWKIVSSYNPILFSFFFSPLAIDLSYWISFQFTMVAMLSQSSFFFFSWLWHSFKKFFSFLIYSIYY